MRIILRFLLAMVVLCPAVLAAPGSVRCGKLLDVRSGTLLVDQVIVFDDAGMITAVGEAASVQIPAGTKSVDLSGMTCLPGLIDVHTHITGDPSASGYEGLGISAPREAVTGVKNARKTLEAGFTTVRNVGAGELHGRGAARRDQRRGNSRAADDRFRPALGITGGHCDNNLLPYEFHYKDQGVADGPWAARAKVREVVKYGADVIKVCASGGVLSKGDSPGTPQYTLEELTGHRGRGAQTGAQGGGARARHAVHQRCHPRRDRFH